MTNILTDVDDTFFDVSGASCTSLTPWLLSESPVNIRIVRVKAYASVNVPS